MAAKSHADSECHKQEIKNLQAIPSFFNKPGMKSSSTASAKPDSTKETPQLSSSGSVSASGSTMASSIGDKSTTSLSANTVLSQSTIDTNIIFNSVTKAEIIWSLFSVCEGFSNNSAKYLKQTFQSMFSECPTAQKFQLWPDKLKYVFNWGLAPRFKDFLKTKLQDSEFLVISFDESLSKSTQNCQMDIGIIFWSQEAKQVEVRYWDFRFLGHATSGDLLENFNKSLDGLGISKIIQISMDGSSVRWCFYNEVVKNRKEMELYQLINIGSCGLHIIHGSFKIGIEVTDWNVKATAEGAFRVLHDSPARRADYISISRSNIFPLFLCATKWAEDKKVAE